MVAARVGGVLMRPLSLLLILVLAGCSSITPDAPLDQPVIGTESTSQDSEFVENTDSRAVDAEAATDDLDSSSNQETGSEDEGVETGGEPATNSGIELINELPSETTLAALKTHVRRLDEFAKSQEPFEIKYTIGPTAVASKVDAVIDRYSEKLKMFQLLGLEKLDMDWVLASENDYEWWTEYRSSQESDYPLDLWNPDTNVLGHCRLSSDVFCGAGNTVNGRKYQDNIVGTKFTNRGIDYVSRHEAAHFYQSVFGYGGRCWWAEGQATFFETYLETTSRSRSQVVERLAVSPAGALTEEELIRKMQDNSVCDNDPNVAYDLGMLAFEYLYMHFSFQQVHELMVLSSNQDWSISVESVLGLESSELDTALAKYVYEALTS